MHGTAGLPIGTRAGLANLKWAPSAMPNGPQLISLPARQGWASGLRWSTYSRLDTGKQTCTGSTRLGVHFSTRTNGRRTGQGDCLQ